MKPEQERQITDREKASRRVSFLPGALCAHTCLEDLSRPPAVLTVFLGVRGGGPARGLLEHPLGRACY